MSTRFTVGQGSLLAALVLAQGEWSGADQLITELWDNKAPATARKALQNHMSRLRAVSVAVRQHRWASAVARLEAITGLSRGWPYADLPESWRADIARRQLREQLLQAEEHLVDALLLSGQAQRALVRAEPQAAAEPFREYRYAQVLAARQLSGHRREALRAVPEAAAAMAEVGLGVGPDVYRFEALALAEDGEGLRRALAAHLAGSAVPTPSVGRGGPEGHC